MPKAATITIATTAAAAANKKIKQQQQQHQQQQQKHLTTILYNKPKYSLTLLNKNNTCQIHHKPELTTKTTTSTATTTPLTKSTLNLKANLMSRNGVGFVGGGGDDIGTSFTLQHFKQQTLPQRQQQQHQQQQKNELKIFKLGKNDVSPKKTNDIPMTTTITKKNQQQQRIQ